MINNKLRLKMILFLILKQRKHMKHLEARKEEIVEDFNKGLSITKLAEHYLCSYNTMKNILIKWGVKK